LEGKGCRTKDDTRVTCHAREKNCGGRTPPGPCVPHGGTPAAPECPLPSRCVCFECSIGKQKKPILFKVTEPVTGSFQSRGLASSSSCRVPNCSRQESILEEWRRRRTWCMLLYYSDIVRIQGSRPEIMLTCIVSVMAITPIVSEREGLQ
jgi:hypothetical protein